MITEIVKLKDLNGAKYNPRKTMESKSKQYERLKASLTKFGTVVPIIVNKRSNTVVGGHQRLNVLKELGYEETEAVVVDLDETAEKQLNIALNKVEGRWDYGKLEELLGSMTDKELEFTGFVEADEPKQKTVQTGAQPKQEKPEDQFQIYMSFPSTESAKKWLKEHNIDYEFIPGEWSATIHMEAQSD